jgi:hypothetical protein
MNEAMTRHKAQSANQAPGTPLKIRGAGGVMRIAQVTPFVLLTLRGRSRRSDGFDIWALVFGFRRMGFGICISG